MGFRTQVSPNPLPSHSPCTPTPCLTHWRSWDCLRHYEILAAGSVPYFKDLDLSPKATLAHLPKALLLEGKALQGVGAEGVNETALDGRAYYSLACRALEYTRR
jgi:hypothetical protein